MDSPTAWPDRLTLENAAQVASLIRDREDAMHAMHLAVAAPPGLISDVSGIIDSAVATVVEKSLEADASAGARFLASMGPLFMDWPATSGVLVAHPDVGQWVEHCNRTEVPLAVQAVFGGRWNAAKEATLNNLAGLGILPVAESGEDGLLPWQASVLHGPRPTTLPPAWRAAGYADVSAGLPRLLNRAWPRGTWNKDKRLPLTTLWNRVEGLGSGMSLQGEVGSSAEALAGLLVGYLLTSPHRHVRTDTPSPAILAFLEGLSPAAWRQSSTLGPDDEGGVRREEHGWPLAAAMLLATLLHPQGVHGLAGHTNAPGAARMVSRALDSLQGAPAAEVDRPLPLAGHAGPTLRGLAALCGASLTGPKRRPAPAKAELQALLAARQTLESFAPVQARADMDRWLVEELLLPPEAANLQATQRTDVETRTDACLRLLGYGLRAKAEGYSLDGEMAKTLVRLERMNPEGLERRTRALDEPLLLALARTPELLARYHMQDPDTPKAGLEWPPFPFPGDRGWVEDGWMPRRLANLAAWERCTIEELGASAVDRTRWFEAAAAVFKDVCRREPGWIASPAAARWLSEQMDRQGGASVRGLSGAGVKALLPLLMNLLEARAGEPLPPGCAFKMARWLDGCADYPQATHAAIEAMQLWNTLGHAANPGALFVTGGLGDASALRGACEKSLASGGRSPASREAIARDLLAGWQAASLAPKTSSSRQRRRG